MDEQVGLRGRLSLISSLVVESSSSSTFSVGGGNLRGGSSGIIELSRRPSWLGNWDLRGNSCWDSIGMMGSLFN